MIEDISDSQYLEMLAHWIETLHPGTSSDELQDHLKRIALRLKRYDGGYETLKMLLDLNDNAWYRAGLLQSAVSFGVISQRQWNQLADEYIKCLKSK